MYDIAECVVSAIYIIILTQVTCQTIHRNIPDIHVSGDIHISVTLLSQSFLIQGHVLIDVLVTVSLFCDKVSAKDICLTQQCVGDD